MGSSDTSPNLGDGFVDVPKNPDQGNPPSSDLENGHSDIPNSDPREPDADKISSKSNSDMTINWQSGGDSDVKQIPLEEKLHEYATDIPIETQPEPELMEGECPLENVQTVDSQTGSIIADASRISSSSTDSQPVPAGHISPVERTEEQETPMEMAMEAVINSYDTSRNASIDTGRVLGSCSDASISSRSSGSNSPSARIVTGERGIVKGYKAMYEQTALSDGKTESDANVSEGSKDDHAKNIEDLQEAEPVDVEGIDTTEKNLEVESSQITVDGSGKKELNDPEKMKSDELEDNDEFGKLMGMYGAVQNEKDEVEEVEEADVVENPSTMYEEDANDNGNAKDDKDANSQEGEAQVAPEHAKEYKDPLRDDDVGSVASSDSTSSCLFDEGWEDAKNDSPSELEWIRQKKEHGQENKYLDKIMSMVGLEEVKAHFIMAKASIEAAKRRDHDRYEMKEEKKDSDKYRNIGNINLNIVLVGNMGTGKRTVADLYKRFLQRIRVVRKYSSCSCSSCSKGGFGPNRLLHRYDRVDDDTKKLSDVSSTLQKTERDSKPILIISCRDRKTVNDITATAEGRWRLPTILKFNDYSDEELLELLRRMFEKRGMQVESGDNELCLRVLVRRVARSRGLSTFGNVRSLECEFDKVCRRQAMRVKGEWSEWLRKKDKIEKNLVEKNAEKNAEEKNAEEKNAEEKNAEEKNAEEKNAEEKNAEEKNAEEKNVEENRVEEGSTGGTNVAENNVAENSSAETNGRENTSTQNNFELEILESNKPKNFVLTKEDIFGPEPLDIRERSAAYKKLQKMIGLQRVKEAVDELLSRAKANYHRELEGKELLQTKLNRVFLGPPGTGKTTAATLYAQILADLGLLSSGDVIIKNPTDMLSNYIGESEKNTKATLEAAQGKVLVIDDAHMLYTGSGYGTSNTDKFRVGIIDTLVANIPSTPGEDRCIILIGYEDRMKEMFQNSNPGLQRRFPLEDAYIFENYNDEELSKILDQKLEEEEIQATDEAKKVAEQVLSRMRIRPNFGNGGEIDNLLSRAKVEFRKTILKSSDGSFQPTQIILEPQHFDSDYNRASRAGENCHELFKGFVGFEKIINFFQHYQQLAAGMRRRDIDSRPYIPWAFVFKGPPGTGKTSTAKKVGRLYYDMNLLATSEVVTCSVTDLIGEYQGHTGPKVKHQLELGLGKVLFIDEAYRLAPGFSGKSGSFADEAVGELVDAMTNPRYVRNMIIILAGYTEEMDFLMRTNQGLRGRFPDHVVFPHMRPAHCLDHLKHKIGKLKIEIVDERDPGVEKKNKVLRLFKKLSATRSWSNGRDVETLANTIIGHAFKRQAIKNDVTCPLTISTDDLIIFLQDMFRERKKEQRKKGRQQDEDSED